MDMSWIIIGALVSIMLLLRMIKFFVRVILIVVILIAFGVWKANAQDLSVEIANDHIDISVGFNGSSIEIFGDRRDTDTDVAVFVIGPEKEMTVWNKVPVFGAWVNRHFAHFKRQPAYYGYAVSFDEGAVDIYRDLMNQNRIGLEGLYRAADIRASSGIENVDRFVEALTKLKQKQGFYAQKAKEMKFMNTHFFRIRFDIPPSAPTGDYKIHSFLIKNGAVIEADIDDLKVQQTGANAFVLHASKNYSFLYAVFCILLAAASGWLVSAVRLRP